MKSKPYVFLTPEQHIAKCLRRRTISKKMMLRMMGFAVGETYMTTNVPAWIEAVSQNTAEAWRNYSFHPGADDFMYGLFVKQGLLAVQGMSLVLTKKAFDLLEDPNYRATLYGPRD